MENLQMILPKKYAGITPGLWFTYREGFSTVYVEARLRAGVIQEVASCGPTEAGSEQQEANALLTSDSPRLAAGMVEARDRLRNALKLAKRFVALQRANGMDVSVFETEIADSLEFLDNTKEWEA